MRLAIVAVGRMKAGPECDLVERYRGRIEQSAGRLGWSGLDVVQLPEGRGRRAEERMSEEAAELASRIGSAVAIVFDERGTSITSRAFADRLAGWRDEGRSCAFVIGGPDGLDPVIRRDAGLLVSFGALTLPHQLVRVVVAEQLYRALTILAGHPYHRDEAGR